MAKADHKKFDEQARTLRKLDAEGGLRDVPEPEHMDPTEEAGRGFRDSVIGVPTGSEASVESGTGPVGAPPNAAGGAFTRVRNRDLRERDEKEFKKRGLNEDGSRRPGRAISASFEGMMVVERKNADKEYHTGSYSGDVPEDGLTLRPATDKEYREVTGAPEPEGASPKGGVTTRTASR